MKFNLCPIWMDPAFYFSASVFALSMFMLVFSIRKYLEIKNGADFEEGTEETAEVQNELPLEQVEEQAASEQPPSEPAPAPEPAQDLSKAEEFVKGIYQNMASLDDRMKTMEAVFLKSKMNREFAVTFLEDLLANLDSLDNAKIKARIEFLLSDLKK